MKKIKMQNETIQALSSQLSSLVTSIGHSGFTGQLLHAVNKFVIADHLSVFAFDDHLMPHLIAAESTGTEPLAKRAGKEYEKGLFYRHDPNVSLIQGDGLNHERFTLFRLKAEDITDNEYRSRIYDKYRLVDRLSIVEHSDARWFAINLYRDRETGLFEHEDMKTISAMAILVASLVAKHFIMLPPAVWRTQTMPPKDMLEELVSSLGHALSGREVEVCARALLGMTNNGIGLELGIQAPTVATLRKRAYAKLNISSLNELFALCLAKTTV